MRMLAMPCRWQQQRSRWENDWMQFIQLNRNESNSCNVYASRQRLLQRNLVWMSFHEQICMLWTYFKIVNKIILKKTDWPSDQIEFFGDTCDVSCGSLRKERYKSFFDLNCQHHQYCFVTVRRNMRSLWNRKAHRTSENQFQNNINYLIRKILTWTGCGKSRLPQNLLMKSSDVIYNRIVLKMHDAFDRGKQSLPFLHAIHQQKSTTTKLTTMLIFTLHQHKSTIIELTTI